MTSVAFQHRVLPPLTLMLRSAAKRPRVSKHEATSPSRRRADARLLRMRWIEVIGIGSHSFLLGNLWMSARRPRRRAKAPPPVFFAAPGAPSSPRLRGQPFSPRNPRGRSAERRTLVSTPWGVARPWRRAPASRRSVAAFFGTGPRFFNPHSRGPIQRAPRRAVVMPPERGPGAARVLGYEPSPQAPHPIPSCRTSPEDALGWIGRR